MWPWHETLIYIMVPQGTPGFSTHGPDGQGQEMRHQWAWARVQVVNWVTLDKSHLLPELQFYHL